jgi:hypothetical protein
MNGTKRFKGRIFGWFGFSGRKNRIGILPTNAEAARKTPIEVGFRCDRRGFSYPHRW